MKKYIIPALALAAGVSVQAQHSAWLPNAGEFIVTPGFTYSTFDKFWMGEMRVENPGATPDKNGESLDQYTTYVGLEYGILENLAADVTVGYTWTETDAFMPGGDSDRGLADTYVGLRYRILDERREGAERWWPTIAVRVGGIIPGSYDENFPFSAGDGAFGGEAALLLAKEICPGFGVFGDVGYRIREGDVPDDLLTSAGVYAAVKGFSVTAAYRMIRGLSGPDIMDPGFDFPEVKEIQHNLEGGLGYTDGGGRFYQVFYARTVDGRNTGQKDTVGVSVSLPFGGN